MNIPDLMGIDPNREEPDLDWTQITKEPYKKEFLSCTDNNLGCESDVNIDKLNSWYAKYPRTPENEKYYYKDHLLVKVDNGFEGKFGNGTFNGKIIFVAGRESGGSMNFGGDLYNSGSGSSTMIFADKGAQLNFNLPDNGVFNGLIYTDPENTTDGNASHNFNSPDRNAPTPPGCVTRNYTFNGAIIAKGSAKWDVSKCMSIDVIRDDSILEAFTGFIKGNTGVDVEASLENTSEGVLLKPMGFYFY